MSEISTKKVGAGGFWKVLNEKNDPTVIKQKTPFSCVAAVGEMILFDLKIKMTQSEIIDIIGEESTTNKLAFLLNEVDKDLSSEKWHGVIVAVRHLKEIASKRSFGAVLREGSPLGHLVLVEKIEENLIFIKDPWEGTTYQMKLKEFLKVWNGEVLIKWKL